MLFIINDVQLNPDFSAYQQVIIYLITSDKPTQNSSDTNLT